MSVRGSDIGYGIAVGLIVGLAILAATNTKAKADDCVFGEYGCGHHESHEQYKSWHREPTKEQRENGMEGMHCCSDGDCRPTRAQKGDPDNPGEDEDSWYAWDGRVWRRVPPEALLKPDMLNDGRSHICAPRNAAGVYCFSPTGPKG